MIHAYFQPSIIYLTFFYFFSINFYSPKVVFSANSVKLWECCQQNLFFYQQMFQKPKQSPYQSIEYQSLDHSKQTAVKQIELVFTYFAGKSSKYNYQELQQKYFTELVFFLFRSASLEKEINKSSPKWLSVMTLYYTKGRNKPLYFTQFLELLPSLSRILFLDGSSTHRQGKQTQKQQQQAMKALLLLFEKIYHIIREEEVQKKSLKSEEIQQDTKQFLLKLKQSFAKIFKLYFQYEANLKERAKEFKMQTFQNLLQLMKDFDVFPKLISASQLFYIFNEVLQDHQHNHLTLLSPSLYSKTAFPKLGQHFTLTRLVQTLILTSHICVSKLKRVQGEELLFRNTGLSQKEGIKIFLEYMQTVRSVKDKMCKFSKQRFSLIVYEEYAEYSSKAKQSVYSSPGKTSRNLPTSQQKKSFFDIMHNIDI